MRLGIICACIAPLVLAAQSWGILTTRSGAEPHFWEDTAVVVCKLKQTRRDQNLGYIDMQIIAVAAAQKLVPTTLTVEYPIGAGDTSIIAFNPKPEETYLLLLWFSRDRWTIFPSLLDFFDGLPYVKISGMDDPKLGRCLKDLPKLMAESCEATADDLCSERRRRAAE